MQKIIIIIITKIINKDKKIIYKAFRKTLPYTGYTLGHLNGEGLKFIISNDLAGLFAVPNLPQSTKFHHYTTVFLFMLICSISTEEETIGRLLVIYTIFSCIPFLVNTYLGLRFFYTRGEELTPREKEVNRIIDINRIMAYYVYLICCFFNWSYHTYYLVRKINMNDLTWEYYIYYLRPM